MSPMKPSRALERARDLIKQWPHARPPDENGWITSLAAVLAKYPPGLVDECVDPRIGLALVREFPPTVACVAEWCDKRLGEHQLFAAYKPITPRLPAPDYSDDHRQGMLARLQDLVHGIFAPKRQWIRPRGRFELPGSEQDLSKPVPRPLRERPAWRPLTTDELRMQYAPAPKAGP